MVTEFMIMHSLSAIVLPFIKSLNWSPQSVLKGYGRIPNV